MEYACLKILDWLASFEDMSQEMYANFWNLFTAFTDEDEEMMFCSIVAIADEYKNRQEQ